MTDFEKISAFESLYAAHKAARLGKRNKSEVIRFEMRLSENLFALKDELERGVYRVAGYKKFFVFDPKTREIQALSYRDRIVQHSICDNVLEPYFERRLIYDNAACRKGKGTHFAMDRLTGFLREHYKKYGAEGYALKCDISKYFDSIDHDVLKNALIKCGFEDRVKSLLFQIIDSYQKSSTANSQPLTVNGRRKPCGLPIGNQTSQFFALFYLDPLDRLIKEKLRIKHYTRYMDDFILIHHDKEYLKDCLERMRAMIENVLHLRFNAKTRVLSLKDGVDYLGFKFTLTETGKVIRLLKREKRVKIVRMVKRLAVLPQSMNASKAIRIRSVKAHIEHGNAFKFYKSIMSICPVRS
ncbi:MAG: RNA-directed DNA polymerase [Firmicutes bacterium]|nr:RNA-directed DNA polymerase [Bacillota bacterium]